MLGSSPTAEPVLAPRPTLEVVWLDDTTAYILARGAEGSFSTNGLRIGTPTVADLGSYGQGLEARRANVRDLLALATTPPDGLDLGGSARTTFAVLERAHRSVDEGLVHPHLEYGVGRWYAFWGATLDDQVNGALGAIAAALPPVCVAAFGGDAEGAVHDLYACAVDQIARDRLRAAGTRLQVRGNARSGALAHFLAGLCAAEAELPPHPGYASLHAQLSSWVDAGLATRSAASWTLSLRLDERAHPSTEETLVVLEPWLQASDDPTLSLPAALLREAGSVFAFVRSSDPEDALQEQLANVRPILAQAGIWLDPEEPVDILLDDATVRRILQEIAPQLEAVGVPILLPSSWVATSAELRVNLTATTAPSGGRRSSGLLGREAIASFEWQLAIDDLTLTAEELTELAAAKEPLIRVRGRWRALRHADIEKALRFLERRRSGSDLVDLVRAVSGVETDEAGLALGEVTLDATLAELLQNDDDRRFRPLPTPDTMTMPLFPFQERGHGWLRLLGDLGVGGILADDMGLGKTVQAIAMLASERSDPEQAPSAPTLVICPMSVARQWQHEINRFAPSLRAHLHHGPTRLVGADFAQAARASDVVITSYDIATRDADTLAGIVWDRLLLDEAQDIKNPATKRARAIRRIPARRKLALTGTPIENHLGELWALMDVVNPGLLGSRERFDRLFARPIEAYRDERAVASLRAVTRPFILRRPKDSPEVELDLPPITVSKEYCRLTIEQASLYQATVDRWMPRIEEHENRFDRRGAILAMLGQLKQVCNHPEMLLATGRPLHGRSGKLERLCSLVSAIPTDDKALVFTQYPGFDKLAPHLQESVGRRVGFFHGRLAADKREELVTSFHDPDGPSLLLVSLRAGGRGLNLPAANHVFHFDRWWNPAVEQQATDRAHRFGQHKPVFVTSLICTATLEERIDELLESKRDLAEKVISGRADDWLGDLDLDTIRAAVSLAPDAFEEAA